MPASAHPEYCNYPNDENLDALLNLAPPREDGSKDDDVNLERHALENNDIIVDQSNPRNQDRESVDERRRPPEYKGGA